MKNIEGTLKLHVLLTIYITANTILIVIINIV